MPAEKVPAFIARKKMDAALAEVNEPAIVITADTIVLLQGRIIGKPEDAEDAAHILRMLSGNMHTVLSAVCIHTPEKEWLIEETTNVFFEELEEKEIQFYIASCKPYDKAGAYAIQEWIGVNKISRIEGDYYNVVGFPMRRVYKVLKELLGPVASE